MKTIKSLIIKTKENVKGNLLIVSLVLTSVLNDFILRGLTVGGLFKLRPLITSIAILLMLSVIAVLLSNKKRDYMYLIFSVFFGFLNAANYLYYKHFNSFISVGILNQSKNLIDMKNNVRQTIDVKLLLFVIPTALFIYIYKKLEKNNYLKLRGEGYSLKRKLLSPFILGLALLLMITTTLTGTDISRLTKQWNREYLVEQFGIYTFAAADLIKSTSAPRSIKADYGDFDVQLKQLVKQNEAENKENAYTNVLEGKDLYVIHYESVQNFAMDLAFGDGEVTPFLNQLSKESIFFNNFYPQHSVGTSSDSEFTFSTGLYPINNRTVFINHADKQFESIQKLLVEKGYYTMSLHGNNKSFWNRDFMHPNLGYKEVLGKEDYNIDEEVGLGLSDKSFYTQSVEILKQRKAELNKPIMAKLISLSNHYPFDDLDVYGDFDTGYLEGSELSNYLKSMNYADQALQQFFEEMENEGLLDNAAVVIYGDHHAKISSADYELMFNYDEALETTIDKTDETYVFANNANLAQVRKTPLLIWTKDGLEAKEISEPIGMINVMPTLSNMLNINNSFRLAQDIFNIDNNTVIYPDGSFLTKEYYYSASAVTVYDMHTNKLILEEADFDQQMQDKIASIEKQLELSSNLIEHDLIQYYKNDLK